MEHKIAIKAKNMAETALRMMALVEQMEAASQPDLQPDD